MFVVPFLSYWVEPSTAERERKKKQRMGACIAIRDMIRGIDLFSFIFFCAAVSGKGWPKAEVKVACIKGLRARLESKRSLEIKREEGNVDEYVVEAKVKENEVEWKEGPQDRVRRVQGGEG